MADNNILYAKDIIKILPHRYPFLLVDKIEQIVIGEKAVGYKNVSMNEYYFQGHFPDHPVMPGVLIIEALAQVGAVAILSKPEFKGKIALFGGISKARFKRKVVPGDVLKLEVQLTKLKGRIGTATGVATVDCQKAAVCELIFAIQE